ncbi:MAG: ribulose-phosphate 3-epimerase [Bacilli bacterium]|nr:ribulose-phosphate 3-epimerase [Bacilli bacterium]
MKAVISPSILTVEKAKIPQAIKEIENNGARWIHFDVMDGKFVPAKTFSLEEIKSLLKQTRVTKDVHIMISNPREMVKSYCDAGANYLTFHYEACKDFIEVSSIIDMIHSYGAKAGLSVKPDTDIKVVLPFLNRLDLILVMSVEPGKGGQKFIEKTVSKINLLNKYKTENKLDNLLIEVDGGINDVTSVKCIKKGANVLVVGSYIFNSENPVERFKKLSE